jgi:DNA repair exonuclease SbcCD nuclease subunit
MAFKIGFFADTHIGYAAKCRTHSSGINMRNRDGMLGFRETVDQMLAANIDVAVHGGDLYHRSHPAIAEIAFARRQLERLSDAGIPSYIDTGNHDFANDKGKSPATAAIHDPSRNIHAVIEPYKIFSPVDGLNIHMISHLGLISTERIIPEPTDGEVNIFTTHGAAQVPGHEVFACLDSPGEAVIGYDVLTLPWSASLLGHYHGMGPLPGFDAGGLGQAWYAGSLLRRGFSDPEGGRGWLLATINDDGTVTIERQYVKQRAQFDLDFIDASGLTGAEVEEKIRMNIASVDTHEAIIRQRVVNCSLAVRRGVDTKALSEIMEDALVWQSEFIRPAETDFAETTTTDNAVSSLSTAGSADLPGMFTGWFGGYAERADLAVGLRPIVEENGLKLLQQVSEDVETGVSEIVASTARGIIAEEEPI